MEFVSVPLQVGAGSKSFFTLMTFMFEGLIMLVIFVVFEIDLPLEIFFTKVTLIFLLMTSGCPLSNHIVLIYHVITKDATCNIVGRNREMK